MYTLLTARGYNQGKPCLTRPFIKEERGKDEHCKLEDILASLCVQPEGKSYCSHSAETERKAPSSSSFSCIALFSQQTGRELSQKMHGLCL